MGAAGLWWCALISVGQWFHKRKALALGIVAAGSSTGMDIYVPSIYVLSYISSLILLLTGGVVHPIYLRLLINRVGFPTAIRWSALVIGISALVACTLMRTRLPRKEWDSKAWFFDISLFKQPVFTAYSLGSFLAL